MALPSSQYAQSPGLVHVGDGFTGSGASQAINQYGQELENNEGRKPTYSAYINAFTPQATPQDFFTLTGSPLVVARLLAIEIFYAATAAAAYEIGLYYNSAALTGGTSTAPTAVTHDPNDVAASCAVAAYTVAPTAGTHVGLIRAGRVVGGTVTGDFNVISGNTNYGVLINGTIASSPYYSGSPTYGNVVEGNFIGTDISGTMPLGNGNADIEIDNGSYDNTIGGINQLNPNGTIQTLVGNVISGNYDGIVINGSGTAGAAQAVAAPRAAV